VPELPDVDVYVEAIAQRVVGAVLAKVRVANPFVVRTFQPRISEAEGQKVVGTRRVGKRVVLELTDELFLVVHLMVAGRFRWKEPGAKVPGKLGLAAFDFAPGTLILTEAGTKRRASIHVVRGEDGVRALDPGGLEVMASTLPRFRERLRSENHTLKRALTDPHLFSGIGNAYSDEILHAAKLSPVKLTSRLDDAEIARLHAAAKATLKLWRDRLRAEAKSGFPDHVTAFRPDMAVHGKYGKPCPMCGAPVQRIVYAENESNYCAPCQTEGKLLADRAMSRLLKGDWPRSLDELEEHKRARRQPLE